MDFSQKLLPELSECQWVSPNHTVSKSFPLYPSMQASWESKEGRKGLLAILGGL